MNTDDAQPREATRATILTGGVETHYRRAGRGEPVLLLFREVTGETVAVQLFRELAHHFRVILLVPPSWNGSDEAPVARSEWLRELMEGLGVRQPRFVAEAGLADRTLGLTVTDGEWAGRLALVCRERADPAGHSVLEDTAAAAVQPVLVLRLDAGDTAQLTAEQIMLLVHFLCG